MTSYLLMLIATGCWLGWQFVVQKNFEHDELGRFSGRKTSIRDEVRIEVEKLLEMVASVGASRFSKSLHKQFIAAGIDSEKEIGRFVLSSAACFSAIPVVGLLLYGVGGPTSLPVIFFVGLFCALLPALFLVMSARLRILDIRRDLPMALELVLVGSKAGSNIAASLEHVVQILRQEYPNRGLTKELHRARTLVVNGYTWVEALDQMSARVDDDSVRRSCHGLSEMLRKGGEKTRQLEGIANDAQRGYAASLRRQLSFMPLRVALVPIGCMVACATLFLCLP